MYEECNGAEKYYFYDSNGIISGIRYFDANGNMTMIYVVTNAQGDVIALYDKNGNAVVRYEYDAWGNIISIKNGDGTTLSGDAVAWNEINPFRYRGYYYDAETGLYYLQSRYYDSETGRFINADVLLDNRDLNTINPFAYCGNNPVMCVDFNGKITIGFNINFNFNIVIGVSVSIGIVFDDDGNVDVQLSYAVPFVNDTMSVGIIDVGGGVGLQIVDVDTVYDLYGTSTSVGGSIGSGPYGGLDYITLSTANDLEAAIKGVQFLCGVGAGMDFHIVQSKTISLLTSKGSAFSVSSGIKKQNRVKGIGYRLQKK